MAWVKLDDKFAEHPKLASVGPLGLALQTAALCYANSNLTDGFIPYNMVQRLLCWDFSPPDDDVIYSIGVTSGMSGQDVTSDLVAEWLVKAGIWEQVKGGYQIHDYTDYQPSKADIIEEREKNAQKMAAWRERHPKCNENVTGSQGGKLPVSYPAPDPVPVPERKEQEHGANAPTATSEKKPTQKQILRSELLKHFLIVTGLPAPKFGTKTQAKESQRLWYSPLDEIAELGGTTVDGGNRLIDETVKRMRNEPLTISDPNSILKTARLIYGEQRTPQQQGERPTKVWE